MKRAAQNLAILGLVSAIVLAALLAQGFTGLGWGHPDGTGSVGNWAPLVPWLIIFGVLAFVLLLLALVFGAVSWTWRGKVTGPGRDGPATVEATKAVVALSGPSLQAAQVGPAAVRIRVASVGAEHGLVLVPFVLRVEMEIQVYFDEDSRRYGYVSTWVESSGLSLSAQKTYGAVRHKQRGLYLTLDGVEALSFDTGVVFNQVDKVLAQLGWQRS